MGPLFGALQAFIKLIKGGRFKACGDFVGGQVLQDSEQFMAEVSKKVLSENGCHGLYFAVCEIRA
jgi:hypothetical protein